MKRKKLYRYNSETDNFERYYPNFKDRIKNILIILIFSIILGGGVFWIIDYNTEKPPVEEMLKENKQLKKQYKELEKRINSTVDIMSEIQRRDTNFYRVIAQMNPHHMAEMNPRVIRRETSEKLKDINDSRLLTQLMNRIDSLERDILHQSMSFDQIRDVVTKNKEKTDRLPGILPINIRDYSVGSGFGKRVDPVYKVVKFHEGLDILADEGTNVYATADGKVSFAGEKDSYGQSVEIDHGNNYTTRYAHLSKVLVKNGQSIKRGELIGLVGSSGKSMGPHLHYEVRLKDEPQNPVNYFFMDITPIQYDQMIKIAGNAAHSMD